MTITGVLLVVGLTFLGGCVVLALLSLFSPGPKDLGEREGKLPPCPASPNCVCSCQPGNESSGHSIAPLRFTDSPEQAWKRLTVVLSQWPRTRIVRQTERYLHAECRSRVFRFVDDVQFLLDTDAGEIHVRSASRVGHSDLGVNRKRVEALRQAFAQESNTK